MRIVALALVVAMLCFGHVPARADDAASVSPADQRAIERTITSQLDAFRHDAGDVAFSYASPAIQALFGDPAHFMAMVQQGYPPVYRSRAATFDQLVTIDDHLVQRVLITGPDGLVALALYTMERQPDGSWKIDGCDLLRPERITT